MNTYLSWTQDTSSSESILTNTKTLLVAVFKSQVHKSIKNHKSSVSHSPHTGLEVCSHLKLPSSPLLPHLSQLLLSTTGPSCKHTLGTVLTRRCYEKCCVLANTPAFVLETRARTPVRSCFEEQEQPLRLALIATPTITKHPSNAHRVEEIRLPAFRASFSALPLLLLLYLCRGRCGIKSIHSEKVDLLSKTHTSTSDLSLHWINTSQEN